MSRLAQLERLLAADPQDADVLYMIAQEHARAGDFAAAAAWYDRCLGASPSYLYAYYHKARAQQAAGDGAGAAETLRRGLALARQAGDAKAASEIASFLDEVGG